MAKVWNLDKEDVGAFCIGFDTAHYQDTLNLWPKEKVEEETENLKQQLIKL